jgi:hypothetical protein
MLVPFLGRGIFGSGGQRQTDASESLAPGVSPVPSPPYRSLSWNGLGLAAAISPVLSKDAARFLDNDNGDGGGGSVRSFRCSTWLAPSVDASGEVDDVDAVWEEDGGEGAFSPDVAGTPKGADRTANTTGDLGDLDTERLGEDTIVDQDSLGLSKKVKCCRR